MPSLTAWTQLKLSTDDPSLRTGLQARILDPLWLLGRQWQFGEFRAQDGGSPVQVRLRAEAASISRYASGLVGNAQTVIGQMVNASVAPLEALVEAERVPLDDTNVNLRQRAEAGLYFLRLLGPLAARYRQAYLTHYPLPALSDDQKQSADADSLRRLELLAGRSPDGGKLYANLSETVPGGTLPVQPPIDAADVQAVLKAAKDWLTWHTALFQQPPTKTAAWNSDRLEYQFSLSAPGTKGETVLVAPEYPGGRLDWYSFSVQPSASLGGAEVGAPAPVQITRTVIPMPVRYPGMPANRFWEFEDARVDFGAIDAAPDDLARLLMVEFALVFGGDHFVIPIDLTVGSICRVNSLVVTDTFGYRALIPASSASGGQWRMFQLSVDRSMVDRHIHGDTANPIQDIFFLPPTISTSLESEPIEDVLFLRDEMANLVWAVERVVQGPVGQPVNRVEVYREHEQRRAAQEPAPISARLSPLTYRLATAVPDYWIPLIPARPGIAWWRGEGNGADSWGNNTAILNGVSFAPGRVGQAFNFGGANAFIRVPASPVLDLGTYTFEVWLNWQGGGQTSPTILSKGLQSGVNVEQYALMINRNGRFLQHVLNVNGLRLVYSTAPNSVPTNTWVHVAGSFDGQIVKTYINGQPKVSQVPTPGMARANPFDLHIGHHEGDDANSHFNGLIDELALYDRVLADAELAAIYSAGGVGKLGSPAVRLLRGTMLDPESDELKLDLPLGQILQPGQPLAIYEEEVPSEGARVTRSYQYTRGSDGSTYLWLGRRKRPGQGEGSSGLRFDFLQPAGVFAGAGVQPPSGLVAWWSGDNHARDLWSSLDGTLNGGVTYDNGLVGQAFNFDGTSGFIRVPASQALNLNTYTFEGWVNWKGDGQEWHTILCKGLQSGANVEQYALFISREDRYLQHVLSVNGTRLACSTPNNSVPANTWVHVASSFDRQIVKIYLNGRLLTAQQVPTPGVPQVNTFDLRIGQREGDNTTYFNGLIDELSLYNRALADEEIAAIYAAGAAGKFKAGAEASGCVQPPSGLVRWWTGDGGPADLRGAANGTTQGGVSYVPGLVGQAFRFDGSGYVQAAAAGLPAGTEERTLELWVQLDQPLPNGGLLAGYGQPGVAGAFYGLYIQGVELRFQPFGSSLTTGVNLQPGVWYHLAASNIDNSVALSLNGEPIGNQSQNLTFNTPVPAGAFCYIGGLPSSPNGALRFQGLIDEVSVYNRALRPEDIRNIYRAGSAGKCRG
jgi:hypothetical protein